MSSTFLTCLKRPAYLHNSATLLLFFASWGVWWSFFQIWLTSSNSGLALNGHQVGIIYSANAAATLVIMLLYGVLQDKLQLKRHLITFASLLMSLLAPFVIWVYHPLLAAGGASFMLGVGIGAWVLAAGFIAAAGLFEAFSERLARAHGDEYGQVRMWGSVGYALAALLAGVLFTHNPALNFWCGSLFGVCCLLANVLWKSPVTPASMHGTAQASPNIKEIARGLCCRPMFTMVVFVLLSWTFYTVFDQQMFPDFYTHLFDSPARGQRMYALLNAIQVCLEAVMLGLVPLLMHKIGVKPALMLGITVMFLRIAGCAYFTDPLLISLVKLLHAPEVALCVLPIFRYFTLHFNPALSVTFYMVGFQLSSQVGNILLSPVLGALRDSIGYQPTFCLIAGIVLLAGVYGLCFLKGDKQRTTPPANHTALSA
ncbi:Sucrose permease [Carnimonas sp. R-84865]